MLFIRSSVLSVDQEVSSFADECHLRREAQNIRSECNASGFRILIIGRANAGKTTILQKLCNTSKSPVVYGPDGKKVRGTHHSTTEFINTSLDPFIYP